METTMATLNQYTRRGVGSFVRLFVRSAGRSVTQAKSPRGPIGHVRERSSLFHFQVPLAPAASLLLPPPPPPLTRITLFPSFLSGANGVFIRRVSFRRYGVTDANGENVLCQLARYDTCESHMGRGKRKKFTVRDLCPIRKALKSSYKSSEKNIQRPEIVNEDCSRNKVQFSSNEVK